MKNCLSLCVTLLALPTLAFAGGQVVGNGGDAIVCPGKPAVLLDLYESKARGRGFDLDLGEANLEPIAKVKIALQRLRRFSENRYQAYLAKTDAFFDSAVLVPGIELEDIPDSNQLFLPKGCHIEQLVIQSPVKFPNDKFYTINKDIWDTMDADNQAATIVHEILYTEGISYGQKDSTNVRYLNSFLTSKQLADSNMATYLKILNDVGFVNSEPLNDIVIDGNSYRGDSLAFYPNGNLKSGTVISPHPTFSYFNRRLRIDWSSRQYKYHDVIFMHENGMPESFKLDDNDGPQILKVPSGEGEFKGSVQLYSNGFVKRGELAKPITVSLQGQKVTASSVIEFYENGELAAGHLSQNLTLKSYGREFQIRSDSSISLSAGEKVRDFVPAENMDFEVQGQKVTLKAGDYVSLYEDGRLKSGTLLKPTQIGKFVYRDGTELKINEDGRIENFINFEGNYELEQEAWYAIHQKIADACFTRIKTTPTDLKKFPADEYRRYVLVYQRFTNGACHNLIAAEADRDAFSRVIQKLVYGQLPRW